MTVLTKQQVLAKIVSVGDMDENELYDFVVQVSMSDVDDKAKLFLYRAIDVRKEELAGRVGAGVVNGDLDDLECD